MSMRFHKHISKRDYAAYGNLTKSDEGNNVKYIHTSAGVDVSQDGGICSINNLKQVVSLDTKGIKMETGGHTQVQSSTAGDSELYL